MEDPVVLLERNLFFLKNGWEKVPHWECLFVHLEKRLFLSVYVDDIKNGWKETKY